ncbi:hypothetical protein [Streptomyces sp. NBC_01431]|uniref:hypothetical protein n=1 Tax=Streptomyces sp. NBC_01431 TaxID=2903863 RepID=UPI002E36DDAE|nr:hypothetical protein [Streptomyces sp. NBC_01431]
MRTRLMSLVAPAVAAAAISAGPAAAAASGEGTTFVTAVHEGNLAEITAGHDARQHAQSSCVKTAGLDMVRGGGCRAGKDVGTVRAGTGGYLAAPTPETYRTLGALSMAIGGLLAAIGTAWTVRNRRRTAKKR